MVHSWPCATPSQPYSDCGLQWMQPPPRYQVPEHLDEHFSTGVNLNTPIRGTTRQSAR